MIVRKHMQETKRQQQEELASKAKNNKSDNKSKRIEELTDGDKNISGKASADARRKTIKT